MVEISVFFILFCFFNLQIIQSVNQNNDVNNELIINTTSGLFQGKEIKIQNVSIRQFYGIPYGEKPMRFEMPILRKYNNQTTVHAINRTPACLQTSSTLSYGPFQISDMYDEDCLTLNMFIPATKSLIPKAIMVFCHGGSNQVGSASLFDGSVVAAIGDIIVITINYRLNIFGYLTPDTKVMSGNYGLHDQILALQWISMNAKNFNGDAKRITYVGHSAGAANAILLTMSKRTNGLIARVIAQSGGPLNQWAIDRHPKDRFNNVIKRHGLKAKSSLIQENIEKLKTLSPREFRYMYPSGLESLPNYPFPVIDNDILSDNLEELIRTGPLANVDVLIGATADESLYFAEKHIFHHYLPKNYRAIEYLTSSLRSSTKTYNQLNRTNSTPATSIEHDTPRGYSYFKKNKYIKKYLELNYPHYLCYYEDIQARYIPQTDYKNNITEVTHLYTNLISDLMFYYDIVRFLHERLNSQSSASTYVYYYTYPPIFEFARVVRRMPHMVGHFAELDVIWGVPLMNRTNESHMNIPSHKNLTYSPKEIELSHKMIRYWTNFVKTGNPNEENNASLYWPQYEQTKKSYINFHADKIRIENQFLEDRFQFWHVMANRPVCNPFRWYQTLLLVSILIFTLILIATYIFLSTKRSRRNIKPTELTTNNVVITYQFLPNVVS